MSAQIVLAEDDPALCTVLNFALKDAGYDVRAYASANKAWDATGGPLELDLLVTDLSFPNGETNGLALSRNAISHHKSAAVLFITADANAAEFARDTGHPVLLKPFTILTFVQRVQDVLTMRASHDQVNMRRPPGFAPDGPFNS
jgi:two-component system alkaline phosphatase synthesis response regulator PhoP